jgi:prepilin-type N-terminal cleavage/methylation domain-containing protein
MGNAMPRVVHRCKQHFSGQRGFTLFEIVMVLFILGMLFYFVATRLFSGDVPTQNAEMELVKNHLRFAQSKAMNSEMSWGIKFGTSSRYWLFNTVDGENTVKRLPGVESSDAVMELTSVQVTPPAGNKITFDSFGSPGGSTITISTTAGTITVTQNTGFIP